MTVDGKRWIVNDSRVAARVIDGEAIMIDLSTGLYYSMDGVGGFIWGLVQAGHSTSQIVQAVVLRYDVGVERARKDLERLLAGLRDKELVVEDDGEAPSLPRVPGSKQLEYAEPELCQYDDMGDLLALDPPMPGMTEGNWSNRDEDGTRGRFP